MKKMNDALTALTVLILFIAPKVSSQQPTELRIDPLLLVSYKECRNITKSLSKELYPSWDLQNTPVLFYRPNVQELLTNFPHKPEGFSEYTGFNPLGDETIYIRNESTLFDVDDQNTSREIDGIPVLVVADPFSRMRNQLRSVLMERSKEFATRWMEGWGFVQSPYDELLLILHEAFHVYQDKMAPEKSANEMIVSKYPLLDPVNNALYVLEGNILKDALLSQYPKARLEKIKEFVAVRNFRQSRLDTSYVEYENLTEYSEGLAKYVEYKFMKIGETVEPIREMYYHDGFNGYRGVLAKLFQERISNMVNIVSVNDDRFGNKFGSGPLRFKLYELGACQALLLDEVMPTWKEKIFDNNVYLSDMLKQFLEMSTAEMERHLKQAKLEYKYDEAYKTKLQFEQEGREKIQEKLASILHSEHTLVKISYGGFADKIGIAFTPFGVTQVGKDSAIYDMVPIKVRFKEGVELQCKQAIPVLIDKGKKQITFAVSTPTSKFRTGFEDKIETEEFILSGAKTDIRQEDKVVVIQLK